MSGARRKILITGGTSGIGLALARKLAVHDDVMVTGQREEAQVKDILPEGVSYVRAPLDDPQAATQTIAQALLRAGWTKLDFAVLNAGIGFVTQDGLDDPDHITKTLDVNLTSAVLLSRALHPWLLKASGTLTLVGSVAHKGQASFPVYAASKAGLHGFARALRSEWAGKISVQIIHPGPTQTDMHAKAGFDPGWMRNIFLTPENVAAMMIGTMRAKRSPVTASFMRYLTGGATFRRPL